MDFELAIPDTQIWIEPLLVMADVYEPPVQFGLAVPKTSSVRDVATAISDLVAEHFDRARIDPDTLRIGLMTESCEAVARLLDENLPMPNIDDVMQVWVFEVLLKELSLGDIDMKEDESMDSGHNLHHHHLPPPVQVIHRQWDEDSESLAIVGYPSVVQLSWEMSCEDVREVMKLHCAAAQQGWKTAGRILPTLQPSVASIFRPQALTLALGIACLRQNTVDLWAKSYHRMRRPFETFSQTMLCLQ